MKLFRHLTWEDSKPLFWFGIGAIGLILLDLGSKWLVERLVPLTTGPGIEVIPNFLYITKSYNVAIAFSLGSTLPMQVGRGINIVISLVMSTAIVWYWILKDNTFGNKERVCAMLLASGAIGNLIDRAFYWMPITGFDGVIDFIQFYLGGGPSKGTSFINPFATFNLADSFLTIGIIYLIVLMVLDSIKESKNKKSEWSDDPRLVKPEEKTQDENHNH